MKLDSPKGFCYHVAYWGTYMNTVENKNNYNKCDREFRNYLQRQRKQPIRKSVHLFRIFLVKFIFSAA